MFVRLAEAMEPPELASAERFGPKELRLAARDEVNRIVAAWVASLDLEAVLAQCLKGGVPASLVHSIADIFEDPQYGRRSNIKMMDSRAGEIAVPNVEPRLSGTPGETHCLPQGGGTLEQFKVRLGCHNHRARQDRAFRPHGRRKYHIGDPRPLDCETAKDYV